MMASRFCGPIPYGTYEPLDQENFSNKYFGLLTAVGIDKDSGEMSNSWQVKLPPWSYDLSDAGKKVSDGWVFLTCYNSEEAFEQLEVNSIQNEMDYIVCINWKEMEKAANDPATYEMIDGGKVIDPAKVPGGVYLVPCPQSPHGVDVTPDGKYFVGSGKLSPNVTIFGFEELQKAIAAKDFQEPVNGKEVEGMPVINYESVRVAQVEVGNGPLHTQFDDQGFAYTTLFIDSQVCKWSLSDFTVKDKVQVHYSPGHLVMAEGDTCSPDGKYLVSLNKLAKDKYLPVGPSHPESMQLVDLTGEKMKVIYDAPIDPEPHYAQMIKADKIKDKLYGNNSTPGPIVSYPKDENRKGVVYEKDNAKVVRDGNNVTVYMMGVRSSLYPDKIDLVEGDNVTVYYTNKDFDQDITHGLSFTFYNLNVEAQPGETVELKFVANKPGVYPFYCTNFCSPLHQEMQGYMLVKPK